MGPSQDLKVSRHRRLRQLEDGLKVGDEQWCRGQAVQDPKPSRLRNGEQQIGG
jgi:hypothetical protein